MMRDMGHDEARASLEAAALDALDSPEVATRVFGSLAVDPGVLINCVAASAACVAGMRSQAAHNSRANCAALG